MTDKFHRFPSLDFQFFPRISSLIFGDHVLEKRKIQSRTENFDLDEDHRPDSYVGVRLWRDRSGAWMGCGSSLEVVPGLALPVWL